MEAFGDPGTVGGDGAGEEVAAGERGLGGEGERDAGEVGQRGGDVGDVHGVGADAGGEAGGDEEERHAEDGLGEQEAVGGFAELAEGFAVVRGEERGRWRGRAEAARPAARVPRRRRPG